MNLEMTDEQQALKATMREFLRAKASRADYVRPGLSEPRTGADAVWQGLADLGSTGLLVPEQCGGDGMTMVEAGGVCEELGAAIYPGPWIASAVLATRALQHVRADASDLFADLAAGTSIATVAYPAPGQPDLSIEDADGGTVLTGVLPEVPDASAAEVALAFVIRRPDTDVVAIRLDDSGVTSTPIAGIDPTRHHFRLQLDRVPARVLARLTGEDARAAMRAVLDDILIAWGADALGAAQAVLELALAHARTRTQFGKPIGSFQAVAHTCVDMFEAVELGRSGLLYALWASDAADVGERHLAALRVKAFSDRLVAVGDSAVQVFGGVGFTWEHDAHLYLRRLLGYSRLLGSPGHYRQQLGAALLDRSGSSAPA